MDDFEIIELYWKRDETAVTETERKYGAFCRGIALNILSVNEDAEECVNDAYLKAWNAIPPQRPNNFKAWLGRVVRNLAINLWNKNHAQKRYSGITELLSELEDCVPSPQSIENQAEESALSMHIDTWLRSLPREDRILFVRRYWNGMALGDLAKEQNIDPRKLAQRMYRLRISLKAALEKEKIYL